MVLVCTANNAIEPTACCRLTKVYVEYVSGMGGSRKIVTVQSMELCKSNVHLVTVILLRDKARAAAAGNHKFLQMIK